MKQIIFWVLAIFALVAGAALSFRDRVKPMGLLIPFEVFKSASQTLQTRFLNSGAYFAVRSKAESEALAGHGIAHEALIACFKGEAPAWFNSKMGFLYDGVPELSGNGSTGAFPPNSRLNLVFETDPSKRSLAGKLGGAPWVWIHRIYPEERKNLSAQDRVFRWRRALRERGIRFVYYEPGEEGAGTEDFDGFLRDVIEDREVSRLSGADILGEEWGSHGLKTILGIFILIALGFWFSPLYWVLPVLYCLPYPLDLKCLGFAFSLFSVFLLYFSYARELRSEHSVAVLLFLPARLLTHTLVLGGISYFLLNDPGFQNRAYLPSGVRLLLALPLVVVLVIEVYNSRSLIFSRKSWTAMGALTAGALFTLTVMGLAYHVLRSGNEGSLFVLDLELRLREGLEYALYARPRTREILGLWGLLILFLGLQKKIRSLEIIGKLSLAVFLTSSFNTYSHLHADYWFIVLREVNAFWIGTLPLVILGFLFIRRNRREGILHLGYFGSGNLGDDLLAESCRRTFAPQKQIFIRLGNSDDLSKDEVSRKNILQILELMTRLETFSLGPGGILQDKTSLRSLLYYLGFCVLARLMGMKLRWFGQGVSPFKHRISYALVSWVGSLVNEISVRDEESRSELILAGVLESKITVVQDLAMDLDWKLESGGQPPTLGIVLRTWPDFPVQLWLQELQGLSIPRRYFIFQDDPKLQEQIQSQDPDAEISIYSGNPLSFSREFQSSQKVISMRYHGILLAYLAKIPVLGLVYDKKCASLLSQFSLRNHLGPTEWADADKVQRALQVLLKA